tara:strand:+ start:3992 stop:4774 length:783 start_codon:yes stop_codon:yes gene_type:complete
MQIKAKKSLGQNFLIDKNILKKIVTAGEISKEDKILEIGPGTGNLTEYIIKSKPKTIIVVEKDIELSKILESKFKNQIKIVNKDILKLSESFYNEKFLTYGNLPYNISTQILAYWCLNKKIKFKKLILMFQKEVADRILAKVNTKNYSRITILANWRFFIKKIFDISPECFSPRPKIKSTLLEFIPKNNLLEIQNPKNLEYITRIFFSQRRKMVKKNFIKLFKDFGDISKSIDIKLTDRPQNISIDKYIKIVKEFEDKSN